MRRAADLEMPALAICDRDGVYGTARQHHAAKETGGRAHVGCEMTMEDGSVLPLLVRSRQGYRNLCQLLTKAKLRAAKNESRVHWHELEERAEGLVCLTGDEEGPLRRALQTHGKEAMEMQLDRLIRIFGRGNIYIELQRHRARLDAFENTHLIDLAEYKKLPFIATNGVCYADPQERPLFDAFTCLRNHTHLDRAGKLLSRNNERYLKNARTMAALFHDLPQALLHTCRLSESLEFSLENLGYQFPRYPAPEGETMPETLRRVVFAGARDRYGSPLRPRVRKQLEHELQLIIKLEFCGYFLIVWDLINYAHKNNILVQGRGSAANSAVCYSLGITNVDPIGSDLLFERFLSEGRESWPDIDLDLPSGDRREQMIQEVYRRFSPRGAAMTANVITYRGRSAMREMGKVLQIPDDVLGRFSNLYANGDYRHTLDLETHIEKSGLGRSHPRLPALVNLYQSVYGLPRHLGQHSGGMIISDTPLDTVVPLENASMPDRVVVQWDKDDCEDLGIIKVDLLGLGMMAVIQDTLEACRSKGEAFAIDLATLPKDDQATFQLMQEADTIGVFQIESRAQMATLPRMKPNCFYDVVIEVAIIRPGPIVGNLVHPYLNRRNGREKVTYIAEEFRSVLKRTLGVPLFQEQILKMAMVVANFTGSEAEELRRAMSFHRSEERMMKVMDNLRAAMTRRHVAKDIQDQIVDSIKSFALYGFPESHAISFASLAYMSAWLKVHRAAEFYIGLLNNQPMGFYSCATLIKDAKRHGIRVLPVSVIDSEVGARVVDERTIQLGLEQVHGVTHEAMERLVEERVRRPWRDLDDLLLRCQLRREESRALAKVGALNALAGHRRGALWQVERSTERDLFNWRGWSTWDVDDSNAPLIPMNRTERLAVDYDGLGLTTGPHPMAYIRPQLAAIWCAYDLKDAHHGQIVTVAGVVICRQRPGTAKGHVFISLEDETGISNSFVPAPTFEKYRLVITQESFLTIRGRLQNVDNVRTIYAIHVEGLPFEATLRTFSHDFH